MPRAFLLVMDSVGIGGAPDAETFYNGDVPDSGANTLGHIVDACAAGQANAGRTGPLTLPHMGAMGLFDALTLAGAGTPAPGSYGAATQVSRGKDTPSGHWELAGVPVPWDWTYFPDTVPAFPPEILRAVKDACGADGTLGNCHASGTEIIARYGAAHIATGWPICYTSADSVFQIAAHEEHFGLGRLMDLCAAVAPLLHDRRVGRVIARPFVGAEGAFTRTGNRRDFSLPPPAPVLGEWVQAAGRASYGVGKVGDIFAGRGFDTVRKGDDATLMGHVSDLVDTAEDGALVFANFVEFDSLYGHRRDVAGYARHLEWFDGCIGALLPRLSGGDLLVITADHGNDPTWVGTDHTRERVPVLTQGYDGTLGHMAFCDVATLVARHLGVSPL
ncbi:MAG: phosphopentomutase [Pseudomonadota bacterium]